MGKKPFISKANATKFDLVFRSSQDASSAPQREWIESSRNVGIGKPDVDQFLEKKHQEKASQRYPVGHPLAWLQGDEDQKPLPEERRKEIVSLGFPDDGYDYLQHVRQGHAEALVKAGESQNESEEGGPSVFIPAPSFTAPPDDYKAIDASRLTIHQAAEGDDDAAVLGQGARVFARELQTVRRRYQAEIDEMEDLLRQLDGQENGEGDLLEDFVLSATEAKELDAEGSDAQEADNITSQEGDLASGSELETDSNASDTESSHAGPAPSESRSFASTYWRPERTDRNANLSVIDERFEQLALEYDSDDIGELDQLAGDQATRGLASTDQYSKLFDQFLDEHATKDHQFEGGQPYRVNENALESSTPQEQAEAEVARKAIAVAKEHVQRLQQQEAEPGDPVEQNPYSDDDEDKRERWDCESVLTTRSTLYNHPQKLDQNASQRSRSETAEEKKARKQVVKEAKREARSQKTDMKKMFKEEAIRQKRQAANVPMTVSSMS